MTKDKRMGNPLEILRNYYLYFMLYSMFGWAYEVILEVFIYRVGFSNRGVLTGPYCIIYGVGALLLILLLRPLQKKEIRIGKVLVTPALVFLGILVITTVLELIGSYIMEWRTGSWMWNYKCFAFNFEGRIAPNPSIRFGIGGMIFLYVLQPLFEKLTDRAPRVWLNAGCIVLALLFAVDVVVYLMK